MAAEERGGSGVALNALTATYPGAEAMGARPVPEGAATLPDEGQTGGFFRDGEPLPW